MVEDAKNKNEKTQPKKIPNKGGVYEYQNSGIREGNEKIPKWLIAVSIGLIIWGVYYAITYW